MVVRQISPLLGKQNRVICEIVSVSAPASIYFNSCANDFSPIFIDRDAAESELGKGRATVGGPRVGPGDRAHVRMVQD